LGCAQVLATERFNRLTFGPAAKLNRIAVFTNEISEQAMVFNRDGLCNCQVYCWRSLLVVTTLVFASNASAQDASLLGKEVLLETSDQPVNLMVGAQVAGTVYGLERFTAGQLAPGWVWVKAVDRNLEGWVPASVVVPREQAADYYTDQVRANPQSARAYFARANYWEYLDEHQKAADDYAQGSKLEPENKHHFAYGLTLEKLDRLEDAINEYNKSIRRRPGEILVYAYRGDAFFRLSKFQQSILSYDEVIRLVKRDIFWQSRPSWLYKRGLAKEKLEKFADAIDDYILAFQSDRPYGSALKQLSEIKAAHKEFEPKIDRFFETLLPPSPDKYKALIGRGDLFRDASWYAGAIKDYENAIKLKPNEPEAYLHQASALRRDGESFQALSVYGVLLKADPGCFEALLERAETHKKRGDFLRAMKDYDEIVRRDPKHLKSRLARAEIFAVRKDFTSAIEEYTAALMAGADADTLLKRARAKVDSKDYDGAIADCNAAQNVDPKQAAIHRVRGDACRLKGEFDAAIAEYDLEIAGQGNHYEDYMHRGLAQKGKNDPAGAIESMGQAIQASPKRGEAYLQRALLFVLTNNEEMALTDFENAAQRNPMLVEIYLERGKIWAARRDLPRALADFINLARSAPENPAGFKGRAWISATCPDSQLLKPKRAVRSATYACELSGWKDVDCLATLAAAHAANGSFDKALEVQDKAVGLLVPDDARLEQFRARSKLYRDGKPFRDAQTQ
jgi:tetratricopeptide (TPR) repeat protein